jgi:hypothetical protein
MSKVPSSPTNNPILSPATDTESQTSTPSANPDSATNNPILSPDTDAESQTSTPSANPDSASSTETGHPLLSIDKIVKIITLCLKLVLFNFRMLHFVDTHLYGSQAFGLNTAEGSDVDVLVCLTGNGRYHSDFLQHLLDCFKDMFGNCSMHLEHTINTLGVTVPLGIKLMVSGISFDIALCFINIDTLHKLATEYAVEIASPFSTISTLNHLYNKLCPAGYCTESFLSLFENGLTFNIKDSDGISGSKNSLVSQYSSAYSIFPLFLVLEIKKRMGDRIHIFISGEKFIKVIFRSYGAYGSKYGHLSGVAIRILWYYIMLNNNYAENSVSKYINKFWEFYSIFQWDQFSLIVRSGSVIYDYNRTPTTCNVSVHGDSCVTHNMSKITLFVMCNIMAIENQKVQVALLRSELERLRSELDRLRAELEHLRPELLDHQRSKLKSKLQFKLNNITSELHIVSCVVNDNLQLFSSKYIAYGNFPEKGLSAKLHQIANKVNGYCANYKFYCIDGKPIYDKQLFIYPISVCDGIGFGSNLNLWPNDNKLFMELLSEIANGVFTYGGIKCDNINFIKLVSNLEKV